MDVIPAPKQTEWQNALTSTQKKAAQLFGNSEEQQKQLGYFHTLREICQQPWTWRRTCEQMLASRNELRDCLDGIRSLAFTGSGSSEYAGECVRLPIQNELGISTGSISGGALLMQGSQALPPGRPGLLVSLARSGNSPESSGVLKRLLDSEPVYGHLVMTCNERGSLAREWNGNRNVRVITLPPETNDQSLVMTSSFTNLLLAARFLGMLKWPDRYRKVCETQSGIVQNLIQRNFDELARIASTNFRRSAFLGSGTCYAASREAALKMLEMTSGNVPSICETYLGFRHGPMSFVRNDTLIFCQLSSNLMTRAYELDLLSELNRKKLGLCKVIVGENIPDAVVQKGDAVIECPGLAELGDDDAAIVYVVVAQLLAFFRCLEEGLQPDSPSEDGIINRVVEGFPLHNPS